MRLWVFLLALIISHSSHAGFDPSGEAVEWAGQIVSQYRSGDDTCFELQRHQASPNKFKTCVFGYYDPAQFGPGKWLKVAGTLQPRAADTLPLVLGAQVTLIPAPLPPRRYYGDPWYNPYHDPFFDPYHPYYW
ncbi:hypothetical protein CAP31_10850 [Sulfuriferula sp. AH1]|uniref:hypothetical protein n=1 Tax=Sulfuriferula sp. AH1 TaxID=1985873 RepID=UPI000B3B1ECA|nr:hypothetical protein [Sulfuriferula sp. AH1]ARU32132.1 hypothetical protein CAP31_10850 [Sulfuriferula sp. AH1]